MFDMGIVDRHGTSGFGMSTRAHANEVASNALVDSGFIVASFDGMTTSETLMEVFTSEEYRKTVGAESMKNFERGGQMFSANFAIIIDNRSGRVLSFLRTRKLNQWTGMVRLGKGQLSVYRGTSL